MGMSTMMHLNNGTDVKIEVSRLKSSNCDTNTLDLEVDSSRLSVFMSNNQLADLRDKLDNYLLAHEERCESMQSNPCVGCDKECWDCDHSILNGKGKVV